jgi:hypothetical protein
VTKSEVAKLVAVMAAAFPNAKVTPETSSVYERMLADLEYPAANAAVERLLATCKFLPTVAEIRESALTLTSGEVRAGGEAWGDVLRLIGRYGARRYDDGWRASSVIEDPVAAECVQALGWVNLCDSEDQTADRARFIQLYEQLAAKHRRKQLSESLPAMQRYRALESARSERTGTVSVAGGIREVLRLVDAIEDEKP